MVANMVLNLVLVFGFNLGHVGLALATSLAAFINAGLLFAGLWRKKLIHRQPGWRLFVLRVVFANTLMVVFLVLVAGDWQEWLTWDTTTRVWQLAVLCVGGFMVYIFSLYLSGLRMIDLQR